MKVTVIIPAFNAERYIRETLESVMAQTYRDVEVVVVDDGSRDRTAEIVRSFGDRVGYLYQDNSGGCGKPRNEGMKAASGDVFVFLDSDDLMVPGRIAREVDVLRRHPGVGMVFSNYQDFEGDRIYEGGHFESCPILSGRLGTLPPGARQTILLPSESTELLLTENFGSSSPMVRRDAVECVGPFDETLRASEDFEFQYRVASHYCIALIPQVGWHKRLHQGEHELTDAEHPASQDPDADEAPGGRAGAAATAQAETAAGDSLPRARVSPDRPQQRAGVEACADQPEVRGAAPPEAVRPNRPRRPRPRHQRSGGMRGQRVEQVEKWKKWKKLGS